MSINPAQLEKWNSKKEDLNSAFQKQFSLNDRMQASMSSTTGIPFGRKNAHFDARYAIGCVAKIIEERNRRAILNTGDKQQSIVIDIVPYKGTVAFQREDDPELPLIMVRVSHVSLNDKSEAEKDFIRQTAVKALQDSMPCSKPGAPSMDKVCTTTVERSETMGILLKYFRKNTRLISKEFLANFEKTLPKRCCMMPGVFTSFLSPLYTGKLDKECTLCGIFGKQKSCSRCKLVRYCGSTCQKEDWKRHKHECTDPSTLQLDECGEYLEIDPSKAPKKMEGYDYVSFSCNQSFGKDTTMKQDTGVKLNESMCAGEFRVWKVQVPMLSSFDTTGMMMYTKGKENLVQVVPQMLISGVEGYRKLYMLVKEKGDDGGYCMGGLKLFLYGALTEDRKLRLNVGKVVPLQPW